MEDSDVIKEYIEKQNKNLNIHLSQIIENIKTDFISKLEKSQEDSDQIYENIAQIIDVKKGIKVIKEDFE